MAALGDMGVLTFGVEEEFLLVDARTGFTVPGAAAVLARAGEMTGDGVRVQAELSASQLETATGVCVGLGPLRDQLRAGRARLMRAAGEEGLRLISAGSAVLSCGGVPVMPGDHYARLAEILAGALV